MNCKEEISTSTLLRQLNRLSLKDFITHNDNVFEMMKFDECISDLTKQKDLIPERIIKISGIDRTYGHQLFNGLRKPSRDKVILLSFAMKLTLAETQRLLRSAEKSQLTPKIKRDAVIIYCLNKKMTIDDTQEILFSMNLGEIGEN